MVRAAALAVLIALGVSGHAGAQALSPSCAAAPALEPAVEAPSDTPPSWQARAKAASAQLAWSKPRLAYSKCKRADIEAQGRRINALAGEINGMVDEVNALERRVRAARGIRNAAFRTYAEKRNRKPEDVPVAAQIASSLSPPCPAAPPNEAAPQFPDGANASAQAMRRADEQFQAWAAPLDAYTACRKLERQALGAQFTAAKTEYERSQAEYASYRAAFNTAVARFQTAIDRYTAKIKTPPVMPASSPR